MRVFRGFDDLPAFVSPVVTVGSYDGVHRGHRVLIERAIGLARKTGGESVVVTFSPHPREVLDPEGVGLLNTPVEKALLLERAGVDNMIVIPFSREFSKIPYREFVSDYLVGRVGMAAFVAGYNHHFGSGKEGGGDSMTALAKELGFVFCPVERQDVGDSKVSSTVIRGCIERGQMAIASHLLGYDYFMMAAVREDGTICPGSANKLLPPPGEYVVDVEALGGHTNGRLLISGRGVLQLKECGGTVGAVHGEEATVTFVS